MNLFVHSLTQIYFGTKFVFINNYHSSRTFFSSYFICADIKICPYYMTLLFKKFHSVFQQSIKFPNIFQALTITLFCFFLFYICTRFFFIVFDYTKINFDVKYCMISIAHFLFFLFCLFVLYFYVHMNVCCIKKGKKKTITVYQHLFVFCNKMLKSKRKDNNNHSYRNKQ